MKKKILISTGGSGGHIIPAISLYEHLKIDYEILIINDFSEDQTENIVKELA